MKSSRDAAKISPPSATTDGASNLNRGGQDDSGIKRSEGIVWQLFLLLAAAWFVPMDLWAKNPERPDLLITLAVIVLFFGVGVLIRHGLAGLGIDSLGATYVAFLLTFVFSTAGSYVHLAPLGRWGIVIGATCAAWLVYRLRDLAVLRLIIAWGAFAMAIAPLAAFYGSWHPEPENLKLAGTWTTDLDDTRDVLLIIADAYGSPTVLHEVFGFDSSPFVDELSGMGFDVAQDAHSNYSATTLSIPSLLEMDLIATNETVTNTDARRLFSIMGGEGALSDILADNGYRTVYVESGWLGTQCSEQVDTCVSGPWPDETLYDIAHRSFLSDLFVFELGASFSRGAKNALTWLDRDLDSYLKDGTSDFIYVHLLAPHAPLFLDADCELRPRHETSGFVVTFPGGDAEAERLDAYLDQVRCVNSTLERVARSVVETDSVAFFVGDHGPDIEGQLYFPATTWTRDQIRARFGVLLAGYGNGCDFGEIEYLGDVGRRLLNCLGATPLADLEPRAFLVGFRDPFDRVQEIDPSRYWDVERSTN